MENKDYLIHFAAEFQKSTIASQLEQIDVALDKDEGSSLLTGQPISLTIATGIKLFYILFGINAPKEQACSFPADLSFFLSTDGGVWSDVSRV